MHRSPLARCAAPGTKPNTNGRGGVSLLHRRQPLVHHRHDGMATPQTRTDGRCESTSCLRAVSAFRALHASPPAPWRLSARETAESRVGIVKGRPRRRSLGCPESLRS
jgi:hypothetical protein